jgi:polyisoprenoid-binding protein YceI
MSRWSLDATHAEVGFSLRHLMLSTVRGKFGRVDADVEIDQEHPERSRVTATIAAASLDTGNADRDAHLRSPDFLDADHFPQLLFRSTAVRARGDDELELTGELTIRDVTRPVTLRGTFAGPVTDPWGGRRAGFELSGEIDREAFGLRWNVALESGGVVVGKHVKLQIAVEVVEAAAVAA